MEINTLDDVFASVEENNKEYFKSNPSLKECIEVRLYKLPKKSERKQGDMYESYTLSRGGNLPEEIFAEFTTALNRFIDKD